MKPQETFSIAIDVPAIPLVRAHRTYDSITSNRLTRVIHHKLQLFALAFEAIPKIINFAFCENKSIRSSKIIQFTFDFDVDSGRSRIELRSPMNHEFQSNFHYFFCVNRINFPSSQQNVMQRTVFEQCSVDVREAFCAPTCGNNLTFDCVWFESGCSTYGTNGKLRRMR